jgi:hypothetical protein
MVKKLLMIVIMSLVTIPAASGQTFYYKQYNYLNGLPTMGIYNVLCTNDGYVWIGSEIGLIRFDGEKFKVFDTEEGLPDTEVTSLLADAQDRVWGFTFNRKVFYIKDNVVYNDNNSELVATLNNSHHLSYFNKGLNDEIFFFSFDEIISLKGDKISEYSFDLAAGYHLGYPIFNWNNQLYQIAVKDKVRYIFKIDSGKLNLTTNAPPMPLRNWSITSEGNNFIIGEEGIVSEKGKVFVPDNYIELKDRFHSIYVGKDNAIWYLNQEKGVHFISDDIRFTLFGNTKVNSIDCDFEGNYWISTMADGLFMLPHDFLNKQIIIPTQNEIDLPINVIYVDDLLWAGNTFETTYVLNGDQNLKSISTGETGKYSRVIDYEPMADIILIASDNSLTAVNKNPPYNIVTTFESASIKSLSSNSVNSFAIAMSSGVEVFTKKSNNWHSEQIIIERAFCVQYDENDVLWFSTVTGIHTMIQNVVTDIVIPNLSGKRIVDFEFLEPENIVIVSTDGYGVYAFDKSSHLIVWHFDNKNGLTSDICRQMQLINDTLWINTPKGLNCIKVKADGIQLVRTITEADGLPNNDVKSFYIKHNELYVAGHFGVLKWSNFNDKKILVPPKFILNQIKTDKGFFSISEAITTTYKRGFVNLDYTIISNVRHTPKLEYNIGNGNWQQTLSNQLELSGLEIGKHNLQVRYAVNNDYIYPIEPLTIVVQAPFYLQKWFIPVLIILISIIVSSLIIYRVNILRRKAMAKLKLNEDLTFAEQQSLQSMMNPHFIFNAINSVQQYIIDNDKKEANRYLTQFARLIRSNLESSKSKYITLEDELERLSLYLQFEKVRFGDKLNYHIDIPTELPIDNIKIPSMIIQPFVENAIWHGIIPKKALGTVQIFIDVKGDNLIIEVVDDGVGMKKTLEKSNPVKKSSLGMAITQRRLELLTAQTELYHGIEIEDAWPIEPTYKGTKVRIHLPYLKYTV